MPEVYVCAEKVVMASSKKVYKTISDYKKAHAEILPPEFSNYKVEEGGTGEGTVASFTLTAGPRVRNLRVKVTEPEKGKVIKESDQNSSIVTTFTITPQTGGCNVRIESRWNGATGFKGIMERFFAPRALKKIYTEELNRLEQHAQKA